MSITDQIFLWVPAVYSGDSFFKPWGILILLAVLLHVAERVWPAEACQPNRSLITNGKITLIYAFLSPIGRLASIYFAGLAIGEISDHLTAPAFLVDFGVLISGYPAFVKYLVLVPIAFLPLILYDFFYYWFHRFQHASWLWQQHKLHHSDQALNVSTSYRINWLEDFFKALFVSVPLALILKLQPVQVGMVAVLAGAVSQIWGQFLHSNIRLSFGVMTPVLTGPHFHRVHHSIEAHHQNKNFATFLPLWDILFGTYYRPSKEEYPRTGVLNEVSDPNLREIVLGPLLCWGRWAFRFFVRLIKRVATSSGPAVSD